MPFTSQPKSEYQSINWQTLSEIVSYLAVERYMFGSLIASLLETFKRHSAYRRAYEFRLKSLTKHTNFRCFELIAIFALCGKRALFNLLPFFPKTNRKKCKKCLDAVWWEKGETRFYRNHKLHQVQSCLYRKSEKRLLFLRRGLTFTVFSVPCFRRLIHNFLGIWCCSRWATGMSQTGAPTTNQTTT